MVESAADDIEREMVLRLITKDPWFGHATFFAHRHPNKSPSAHGRIVKLWHSPHPSTIAMVFRGGAKSTLAEEAIILRALLRLHKHFLIVGETYERACDRLRSVKHELENNERLHSVFGDPRGDIWQEQKITLSSGIILQCIGQGQGMRGIKHLDSRPDFLFIDDLENKETVATPEARRKLSSWVYGSLFPALEPNAIKRVAATPLDREAWAVKLLTSKDWQSFVCPIMSLDANNQWQSSWPDKFPIEKCFAIRDEMRAMGHNDEWEQEYMCEPVDPVTKVFLPSYIHVEPIPRSQYRYASVLAVYDPARTTNKTSASTGKVVGSWVANKLYIWEAGAHMWLPDRITEDIFRVDKEYNPIKIGVEKDGLEEFLLQPLRQEQLKRAHLVPIEPLKAPKGKLDFIKGLQPFFKAGEVVFCGTDPTQFQDMIDQLMSFPSGRIDAPNALAYMLMLRGGLPVYDGFSAGHVLSLRYARQGQLYCATNSGAGATTLVMVRLVRGAVRIELADIQEGEPTAVLPAMLTQARAALNEPFQCIAPAPVFDYDVTGLRAAFKLARTEVRRGGDVQQGRALLHAFMQRTSHDMPMLTCHPEASWALRALTGGMVTPPGSDQPTPGVYRVLMEGLEAWAATLQAQASEDDKTLNWVTDSHGRRYISARG